MSFVELGGKATQSEWILQRKQFMLWEQHWGSYWFLHSGLNFEYDSILSIKPKLTQCADNVGENEWVHQEHFIHDGDEERMNIIIKRAHHD